MKTLAGVILVCLSFGSQSFASIKTYSCGQGKSIRKVEHVSGDGSEFACKVTYSRVTEAPKT